jgi:hypothetical protein
VNMLNRQSRTTDKGLVIAKYQLVTEYYTGPRNWRALVNTVMNFRFPLNMENILTSRVTVDSSRGSLFYGVS